ncbi:MAG: response regulator [Bradyrhizobium sp.]|nr:MAG: response regulator [Bradyrhizobium sp.]
MTSKILIVDDSLTSRNLMWLALTSAGYKVVHAINGEDGLAKAEQENPDMVVTDLNMPKLDGLGFTKKLRAIERFRELPIVILTTETERRKKVEAAGAGATAWLTKPFETETLLAMVRKLDPSRALG